MNRVCARRRAIVLVVASMSLCAFGTTADAQSGPTHRASDAELAVMVTGLISAQPADNGYVGFPYLDKGLGGAVPGIAVSANVVTARRLVAAVEISTTTTLEVAQTGRLVGGAATGRLRDSLLTVLAGMAAGPPTRRIQVLAGVGRILGSPTLLDVQSATAPGGSLDSPGRLAVTGGIDVMQRLSDRLGLVADVRYSHLQRSEAATQVGVGRHVLRAGVGVRVRLTHR
jgi:hypothetical protein